MSRILYILKSKQFGFLMDTLSETPEALASRAQDGDIIPVIVKRHCARDIPDAEGYAVGGPGRTILPETMRETEHDVRQCAMALNIDFERIHKASIICQTG